MNNYQSKVWTERSNQFLDYLIDTSFQGVSRLFVLSFADNARQTIYEWYFLPTVEIRDCNVIVDKKLFLMSQLKII